MKKPIIGIIGGTSQFGQWFRFFFENNHCEVLIASRNTELTPKELAKKADIVIISVPIRETLKVIREVRDLLKSDALLCDFTSLKKNPVKEMLKRKKGGVLGMHPLFGPLVPSMEGQLIVFCEERNNKWVGFLEDLFQSKGAKIIKVSPKEHDKQMAMVQSMTHFLNISFAKVLQKQKIQPQNFFSTPVFRLQAMLMGRILGSNPLLYSDLEIENEAFHKLLKEFIFQVNKFSKIVLEKKSEKFEKDFTLAAKAMKNFIPIAQMKTTEIMYILDKQPIEIRKKKKNHVMLQPDGIKVSCLGPEGTYSHLASQEIFSKKFDFSMASTIKQVFKDVANNETKFGVVPAENSTTGIVQETLDCLLDFPLKVIGSHKMRIHHCLLARTMDKSKIKIIRSHGQPLSQCREWINRNFPNAYLDSQSSTVTAILSTMDPSIAFIGSADAGKEYKLKVLAENIEDNKQNLTEFYVLSRSSSKFLSKKLKPRHSLLIVTIYDRGGVLRDILNVFADFKLNLSKLHSRTSLVKGWDYYFFLEIECLPKDHNFKEALKEVRKYCSIVRVFGVT